MALVEVGERSPRLRGHVQNVGADMYLPGFMLGWYLCPLSSDSGLEALEYIHDILLGITPLATFDAPLDFVPRLIAKNILL